MHQLQGPQALAPMASEQETRHREDLAACLVGRARPCEITDAGLLAAEKYLRQHLDGYGSGTPLGSHRRFIASLLSEALDASHVIFRLP